MYNAFYQFRETPFSPDPDQNFLYLGDTYETALAVLANGLANGVGVNVVLGEKGMGKTTFIEYLLRHSPPGSEVGLISEAADSPRQLLRLILKSFGQTPKSPKATDCNQQLVDFLSSVRKLQSTSPLLIVDDAHTLNADTLQWVSKLCAINVGKNPVLQLILVGRKELLNLLKKPEFKEFSRKIGSVCYLKPLNASETKDYIYHRLEAAGVDNHQLFEVESCLTVHRYAKGVPRAINELCQRALVSGGSQRVDKIDAALIHKVAGRVQQLEPRPIEKLRKPIPRKIEVPWYKKLGNSTWLVAGVLLGIATAIWLDPRNYSTGDKPAKTASTGMSVDKPTGSNAVDEISMRPAKSDQAVLLESHGANAEKKSRPPKIEADENQGLFDKEEGHLSARRLTSPSGNNAYEIYQSILDRDPQSRSAQKGIGRIVAQYQELADKELTQGQFGKAEQYLRSALTIRPESADIQEALSKISRRQEKRQLAKNSVQSEKNKQLETESKTNSKEDRVDKLNRLAERQIEAKRFLLPEDDNAFETYKAVLSIAPDDERAVSGLDKIAGRYLELAQAESKKGELQQSQGFVDRGLKVRPEHPDLLSLNEKLVVKRKEQTRKNTVSKLLSRSEQQVAALKLIQPKGDNAYETYREIVAIDKENQQARNGLSEIQQNLIGQLEEAIKDEEFKSALDVADQILAIPSEDVDDSYRMKAIVAALDAKKYIKSQLESLLEEAEAQFDSLQLASPAGQNAFDSYQRVLRIDPANKPARQGLDRLARQYEVVVRAKLSKGDHGQAITLVEEGFRTFPDSMVLSDLRDEVKRRQEDALNESAKNIVDAKEADEENPKREMKTFGTF